MSNLKEQLFSIADRLHAEFGRFPTNAEIRNEIGSGSMSTIAPILREWRNTKTSPVSEESQIAIPEPVIEIMNKYNQDIWLSANKNALSMVSAVKQEYEQKCADIQEELDNSYADIDNLTKEIESLKADLKRSLESEKEAIKERDIAEKKNNEILIEVRASRDMFKAERDEALTDVKRLNANLLTVMKDNK